ncbi:MAG: DNA primase [Bacteroidales bacterium]|nr:DNA primase [Bacteroidales bacterium]
MISQTDIDRILDAAKIEEVIGDFVDLKKRGANYIACCPFHNEDTPSFNVSPSRGIFKCFGCGEGGDTVSFLMKYQHYTYPEALRWLANKYHIEIKEKELSAEELQARDEKNILYHINELACKYYYDNLFNSEEGQAVGLSYFNERQINRKTIDTWQLGYAKQKGDDFVQYALKSGYKEEDLIKSGLVLKSEKDGSLYDRFRGRVTFPVYNVGGRVLGFSARILTKDKTKAKYVNSPESPVYIKGKTLFGLNFARQEIAKQDLCYLVEGNIDAIMMSQNEVRNVVASSGTALTEDQVHLIKRYTSNVAVLYDGDAAGIHAAIRATDMFLKEGMHISIVLFPDGDDPDSFARKHTQDEFQEFLKTNARNFIIYRTNLALQEAQGDPIKKATLVKDIIHSISLIPDLIERTTYIQQCSSILNMREDVLTDQLNKEIIHNAYLKNKGDRREIQKSVDTSRVGTFSDSKDNLTDGDINLSDKYDSNKSNGNNTSVTQDQNPIPDLEVSTKEIHLERDILRVLVNYSGMTTNQPVLIDNKTEIVQCNAGEYILNNIISNEIEFQYPLYRKIIDKYIVEYNQTGNILNPDDIMRENDDEVTNLISTLLMEPTRLAISANWANKEMFVPDINSQQIIDLDIKQTMLSANLQKLAFFIRETQRQMKDNPEDISAIERFNNLRLIKSAIAKELNRPIF